MESILYNLTFVNSYRLLILSIFTVEEAGGKAFPCILDVRDEQQVKAVVKSAVQKVGSN